MIRSYLVVSVGLLALAGPAQGRPAEPQLPQAVGHPSRTSPPGVAAPLSVSTAAETVWFGGTTWAPDSMRWEALRDSVWTFETGVGSAIKEPGHVYPGVDPAKPDGFHTTMEGWTGVDRTRPDPTTEGFFRRLAADDPRWGPGGGCVGSAHALGGQYSFWAGVLPAEAESLCYAAGQGYGNWWKTCIGRSFDYPGGQAVTLTYSFWNETESGYDYTRVRVASSGQTTEVATYTGIHADHQTLTLTPGVELPVTPDTVTVTFCVESDGFWSDEDGLFPTDCGAFALDDVALAGGITYATDFETDDGGWESVPQEPDPAPGGEWSRLMAVDDLPPVSGGVVGTCSLGDSVLVLFDPATGGHSDQQDNIVVSPWIDLRRAGTLGYPGYTIRVGGYHDLPLLNYIFLQTLIQWYPYVCPETTRPHLSPWTYTGWVAYFGGDPICTEGDAGIIPTRTGLPTGSEQVRIGVGVLSYCRFYAECTGFSNTTPWIDNVRFGVHTTGQLQALIDAAADGDTIRVGPGTYTSYGGSGYYNGNLDLDFGGKRIVMMGTEGAQATIIDCRRLGRAFLFRNGEDSTAVVEGFTIRNGLAPPDQDLPSHLEPGGGIFVAPGSRPTVRNCVFENCEGYRGGGLGSDPGSTLRVVGCRFTGNHAEYGGGIAGQLDLVDCVFEGNSATVGGGIYLDGGTVTGGEVTGNQAGLGGGLAMAWGTVTGCYVHGNLASGEGGGAYSQGSLIDCRIENNSAAQRGGGVSGGGGLHRCSVLDNVTQGYGGGLYLQGGGADSCRIAGNSAEEGGGAAAFSGYYFNPALLRHCTVTGNRAARGGGVYLWSDIYPASWSSCTFSGNRAEQGGGIYLNLLSSLTLNGCIVWGNGADGSGSGMYLKGQNTVTLECSDTDPQDFYGSGSIYYTGPQVHADPGFCEPSAWEAAPSSSGDYTLAAGSPCLPAGNTCGVLVGAREEGCASTGVGGDLDPQIRPALAAYPNPFSGSLHLSLAAPVDAVRATVEIFDLQGRLLWSREVPASAGDLEWDGRDASGRRTAPGVYFVHVRAGSMTKAVRVVRLR